jgi:hypothetical protein
MPDDSLEAIALGAASLGAVTFLPGRAERVGRQWAEEESRDVLLKHVPRAAG